MKHTALVLALGTLTAAAACKKDTQTVTPDDGATTATTPDVEGSEDTGDEPSEPAEPDVPQEPDPPEIKAGAHQYLLGHYQEAIDLLTPLYGDLRERSQYRASGLAGGWLALAHAQIVFENGQAAADHSVAMAEQTKDPEVKAVAYLASGAIKLGSEDYTGAKADFATAAEASPKTTAGALANILRAEALIGSAFGSGASDTVENPADLETAKKAYADAKATADSGVETDLLSGRVEEGLAAIARYQRNKPGICEHSIAAVAHLKKAGASEFLVEGPAQMASTFKCDLPK